MITNLPTDLMEDILSRIPLKSMRAVGLTCTKWNTLSKSEILTKMHIGKAFAPAKEDEYEARIIAKTEGNLYLMRILLCIPEDDATRVVVWNPYLGQTRWIKLKGPHVLPHRERFCSGWKEYRYGIGYEDKGSGRKYKILRFIDVFLFEERDEYFRYEIYDFETGFWKNLYITDPYWRITSGCGVSLKGNSYWCAIERDARDYGRWETDHIICFDYTKMRFGPLLPLPRYVFEGGRATLSCLREKKLVVWFQEPFPYNLSYYITTRLEAEKVSWSEFTFSSYDEYSILDDIHIRLSSGGFEEEKKVPMFSGPRLNCHLSHYIGGDGYGVDYIERELPEDTIWRDCVCFYVPSLVQIKQPKISYPRSVQPEQARSTSFLSTNSFASLASTDDED
ncbi:unnamed protein product [Microthlaspi erraticum]|uniref:F-box domain-containing protein n=1 Tax=Microthlaspi erraticum TaxID=1685480 RepID=A0A6D2K8H8_9BRAS|nr:unnamed protein product [Microthlaspi erraticum]